MQQLINETEQKAYTFLREFGFEEEELEPVVTKGLQELAAALEKLIELTNDPDQCTDEAVDGLLHGLKGLLFQLGNHDAANKAERLRHTDNMQKIKEWLERI